MLGKVIKDTELFYLYADLHTYQRRTPLFFFNFQAECFFGCRLFHSYTKMHSEHDYLLSRYLLTMPLFGSIPVLSLLLYFISAKLN